MKVVFTDCDFPNIDVEREVLSPYDLELVVGNCNTQQELIELTHDADFLIVQYAPITAEVISHLTQCKVITRYGVGYDSIDVNAAREAGIPVCNVPDYCIDEVADHTLALMLALDRRIVFGTVRVRSGNWYVPQSADEIKVFKEMVVGLVGCGRIGKAVARRLSVFGCTVLAHDPYLEDQALRQAGVEPVSLDELLGRSDVLSLHCPSNDTTRGMIDGSVLGKLRSEAALINTARGDIVVTDDLVAALQSERLRAAALDVTHPEPLPADHPLTKLENVLLTPHIAAYSAKAMLELRSRTAGAIVHSIRGEPLPNVVNGV